MNVDFDLVKKYNVPGPRYTSYPTALQFRADIPADELLRVMREDVAAGGNAVSVYVHIPFCRALCWYCGCTNVPATGPEAADRYLDALEKEIALRRKALGENLLLRQLHFGGGTPSALTPAQIDRLAAMLREAFSFAEDAEISVEIDPRTASPAETEALIRYAKTLFEEYAMLNQKLSSDLLPAVMRIQTPGKLADFIAGNLSLEFADKQTILEELQVQRRLEKLCVLLVHEIEMLEAMEEIDERVQEQIDENQREYYLREQMKVISQELGDTESSVSEAQKYRERILKLHLEKESEEKLLQECDRFARTQPTSPESAVSRSYLDAVLALPWGKYSKENLNLDRARKILDKDHYGLESVKERILEFLAVRSLAGNAKGQIICLAGPPGVGKTSIARSLARAMNRKYERISLGGVNDESEIRGHRKTYIGSMPGSIVAALTRAKTANPLILLDEIDKLSRDYKGDPASALLEALDPEQNNTFRDHYIEIPFDLSKVLFITTANDTSTIPAPARPIALSGF